MMNDIFTVMWKEWSDLLGDLQRKSRQYKALVMLMAVLCATALPLLSKAEWITGSQSLMYWLVLPFIFTSQMVADSFAGERERHTLETLLATRLSDSAIYLGKLLVPVMTVWGGVQLWMFFTLIPINIAYGRDGLLFFPLDELLLGVIASFAFALMISGIGTLASLHAPTVQSAQVRIGIFSFVLFFLPFAAFAGLLLLPATLRQQVMDLLETIGVNGGIALVTLATLLFGAGLVLLGLRLFRRDRMILD